MSVMELIEDNPVAQSSLIGLAIEPRGRLMRPIPDWKFSHPCHCLQHCLHQSEMFHHLALNLLHHLDLPSLIMAIPSQLDDSKPLAVPTALHVFETSSSYKDYDMYDAAVLQPMIRSSHPYSYIYADKHPDLPLPVAFGP